MLTIYTRHAGDCDHRDDMNWKRCRCPKWIRGVLPNGRSLRTAAKTRSWEQAEKYARKLEAENDPLQPDEERSPVLSTIRDAVQLSGLVFKESADGLFTEVPENSHLLN